MGFDSSTSFYVKRKTTKKGTSLIYFSSLKKIKIKNKKLRINGYYSVSIDTLAGIHSSSSFSFCILLVCTSSPKLQFLL
jgi:hypothetical protein